MVWCEGWKLACAGGEERETVFCGGASLGVCEDFLVDFEENMFDFGS